MNLNYAIFRSEPIYTINDLAQIGSHNKREKQAYNSNPDIKVELSKNNIELKPLTEKYVKGFKILVKDYEKEHNERMKTERDDRKRTFNQMLDKSKNVIADELLFTATNKFFKNMTEKDILDWANTCMDFVYEDLGYTKEQVLHSVIHLDEASPHIHCVVVPLVKKFDKRTNTERYTISKKQYIRDKIHLSELQDKYHKRLTDKGYDLERGIKGSDRKHIKIKDYKKINRKLEQNLNTRNDRLDKIMNELDKRMETTKTIPFDKKHIVVEKDTFDIMHKAINESKKVMELQPKINEIFNEINNYADSYNSLEKDNQKYQREIKSLKTKNSNLLQENNKLRAYIDTILEVIKKFFRKLLQIDNEPTKEATTTEIKDYYDNQDFNSNDIYEIAENTTKEDELFDYADIPSYLKTSKKSYKDNDKDDFEIGL